MKVSGISRHALCASMSIAMLGGCGGSQPPIGAPDTIPQSHSISARVVDGSAVPSYLYVADPGLRAIVAFDSAGNKVVEKTFNTRHPIDVVTDSRGHVYVDLYKNGLTSVLEFTHNLGQRIAEYHPPGYTFTMTVDAKDNLYIESASAGGFEQDIVQYPYGSTRAQRTYRIVKDSPATTTMAGISVRENILYTMVIFSPIFPIGPFIICCFVNGSGRCRGIGKATPIYGGPCGFTIANRRQVYGVTFYEPYAINEIEYDTLGRSWSKRHHDIDLPAGYQFGVWGCQFHSYLGDVWTAVSGNSSLPGEALEVDVDQGKIINTIGAGYLQKPNAAYYGNGFTP